MLHKVSSFHWEPAGSETKLTMERKHRNAVGVFFLFPRKRSETKNCQESKSSPKLPLKLIHAGPVDQVESTTPMDG